ncbi:flavodoxin domain-containing protein [Planococcus sp. ISL-109]|uniref:flavodoxin domain-containing protein n=1 Tax=Planococcus sp. ISL-109 TaxID=2819166 RepID=UPI001BE6694B|nr:flavodoxin domain-containing protein [Planococcus sp. ISL-109]MBT2583273.1 flavodoxin domain-containing protein [Planococcus sp. ISL-109]
MNYKPRAAIVYASATGHTERLAEIVERALREQGVFPESFRADQFNSAELSRYDMVLVGTYTWANGEIPKQLHGLFEAFENLGKSPVTAVFGTGDRCFATYCGAVDQFRDMLYAKTALAATFKVEQMPSTQDYARCRQFAKSVAAKYREHTQPLETSKS